MGPPNETLNSWQQQAMLRRGPAVRVSRSCVPLPPFLEYKYQWWRRENFPQALKHGNSASCIGILMHDLGSQGPCCPQLS